MRLCPRWWDDADALSLGVGQVWVMVGGKICPPPWLTPVFSIILSRDVCGTDTTLESHATKYILNLYELNHSAYSQPPKEGKDFVFIGIVDRKTKMELEHRTPLSLTTYSNYSLTTQDKKAYAVVQYRLG